MRAGGLDRPQRAGVTEQRRLDGIRRPLPRGTIVKNHIDLVHVDMVAKEPVTGPVLIGDRRCTREYRTGVAPDLVLAVVAPHAAGIHPDRIPELTWVSVELCRSETRPGGRACGRTCGIS